MSDLSFCPPGVELDPQSISGQSLPAPNSPLTERGTIVGHSPFDSYARELTAEGGIRIVYRDQLRGAHWASLRVLAWIVSSGLSAWLVNQSALSSSSALLTFVTSVALIALIVRRRFLVLHSVEIRPDCMILDGEDVFLARDIGENWPELQMKHNDPDQLSISGISGNRFIEYMTVNRWDKSDRTPEILEADLRSAMEQLWGRREISFPTAIDD